MSDPRAPHDPHTARSECARLLLKLEAMTDLLETAVMDYVEAEAEWDRVEADAWVRVRDELGSTDEQGKQRLAKDFQVRVNRQCRKQRDAMVKAKEFRTDLEARIRSTEKQLSGAQSVLKSVQHELDMGRYGGVDVGTGEVRPPRPPLPDEVPA